MTTAPGIETLATGLAFPECPRWHDSSLWFSDQHDGAVYRLYPGGPLERIVAVPAGASGLGWLPDGDLLVVSMDDRTLRRFAGGELQLVADLGAFHAWHSNDMIVDAFGRAYVGSIGFDYYGGAPAQPSMLVRVDPDGSVVPVADELWCPNGMAITADGLQLVVAESLAHRLTMFDIDGNGDLDNRRLYADLGEQIPDGICMDAAGRVWFASIGRHEIVRIDASGSVSATVSTGDREVIACAIGGPDERSLFGCTTASMTPDESRRNRDGCIELITLADADG